MDFLAKFLTQKPLDLMVQLSIVGWYLYWVSWMLDRGFGPISWLLGFFAAGFFFYFTYRAPVFEKVIFWGFFLGYIIWGTFFMEGA